MHLGHGVPLTLIQSVAGTVTLAPVGGTVPPGVSRGPAWVPRRVTSCATVFPSARTRSTVPCTSGSAAFQPWQRARYASAPSIRRPVPASTYTASSARPARNVPRSAWLNAWSRRSATTVASLILRPLALGDSSNRRFAPIQVSFMDQVATVQMGHLRVKTFTKRVSHRYRGHYIVRAFADTNPDRYWNICVRQNAAIYSSGGRIYCNVRYSYWRYRWGRAAYKAKLRWTVRGLDNFRTAVATRVPS